MSKNWLVSTFPARKPGKKPGTYRLQGTGEMHRMEGDTPAEAFGNRVDLRDLSERLDSVAYGLHSCDHLHTAYHYENKAEVFVLFTEE